MKEEYINVGRLKKTYGNDGSIRFTVFNDYEQDLQNTTHFFLDLDGIFVPFFFNASAFVENIFKLKGIDALAKTEELVSKPIFLNSSQVKSEPKSLPDLEFSYLEGFQLFDQDEKIVGKIIKIESYPMQELATLDNGAVIPMSDELIINVDLEAKSVRMELVDGLLNL